MGLQVCPKLLNIFSHNYFYFKQDYEFQKSEEAKFVKDLDKFEMILQAHEYEKQSERPGHLQEFFDSTDGE